MEFNIVFKTNNTKENHQKPCSVRCDIYGNSGIWQLTCQNYSEIYVGLSGGMFRVHYKGHIQAIAGSKMNCRYAHCILDTQHLWPSARYCNDFTNG